MGKRARGDPSLEVAPLKPLVFPLEFWPTPLTCCDLGGRERANQPNRW